MAFFCSIFWIRIDILVINPIKTYNKNNINNNDADNNNTGDFEISPENLLSLHVDESNEVFQVGKTNLMENSARRQRLWGCEAVTAVVGWRRRLWGGNGS